MPIEKNAAPREARRAIQADRTPRQGAPRRETRSADSADRPRRAASSEPSERTERPARPESSDRVDRPTREEEPQTQGSDRHLEALRGSFSDDSDSNSNSNAEAQEEPAPPSDASTFETYFNVYDNPGGGDTDGRVSSEDLQEVAEGDYDREAAEDRLRDQGVDDSEIDDTLDRIEDTARHYTDNEDDFAHIDGIDEGGDTDDRITRDDLNSSLQEERQERADDVNLNDDEAIESLEDNFGVLDNPGGGDTDGEISRDDLEAIAGGDYDREAARERLRDQGVSEADLDARLARTEATATHLLGNEDLYGEVDSANDDGNIDGDIRRGDVDRVALDRQEETPVTQASDEERAEAQEIYRGWNSSEDVTRQLDEQPDLAEYSQAELLALAQAGQDNPELAQRLQEHVIDSVNAADSLDELPPGEGFQHLLAPVVAADPEENEAAANAQEHLRGLIDTRLEGALDGRLRDHRGDSEAELAIDRFAVDVENLARTHPALAEQLGTQADELLGDSGDQVSDVRRADDGALRQAYHAAGDAVRGGYGFVADRIRDAGHLYGRFSTAGGRILGEAADWAVTSGGQIAGAGLDAVGAEGLADGVRDTTRSVGNGINGVSDWASRQTENFYDGLYGAGAGLVEGVGHISTNPIGTARGIATVAQDPRLLLEPYRQTVRENGYAGLAGSLTFDVAAGLLTGGASPAARGLSVTERAIAAGRLLVPTDAASGAQYVAGNAEYYTSLEGPQLVNPLLEDALR